MPGAGAEVFPAGGALPLAVPASPGRASHHPETAAGVVVLLLGFAAGVAMLHWTIDLYLHALHPPEQG